MRIRPGSELDDEARDALYRCWFESPYSYMFDQNPMESFLGMSLYGDKMKKDAPFGFYNPEMIRYGHENLLPHPDDMLTGIAYGALYKTVFQRFVRLMTESYLWLVNSGKYRTRTKAYWHMAMDQPDLGTDGVSWLQKKYRLVVSPGSPVGTPGFQFHHGV